MAQHNDYPHPDAPFLVYRELSGGNYVVASRPKRYKGRRRAHAAQAGRHRA